MNIFHIGFPLIGTYSSLAKVEAVVVVTYKMENIARTSALISDATLDYTYRYLSPLGEIILTSDGTALTGLTFDL